MKINHIMVILPLVSPCSFISGIQQTLHAVQAHAVNKLGRGSLIVGSASKGMQEASLAQINRNKIINLAPEKVRLNDKPDCHNPFFNEPISHIVPFLGAPRIALATPSRPSEIFLLEPNNIPGRSRVFSSGVIKDNNGKPIAGVVAVASSPKSFVFAAVKEHKAADFGTQHSGIALIRIEEQVQKDDSVKFIFKQSAKQPIIPCADLAAAMGIDPINIVNVADMWWDVNVNMLFIALEIRGENSKAQALLRAYIKNGEFVVGKCMPDESFDQMQYGIFGTEAESFPTSFYKVRSMETSTRLHYLIAVGGKHGIRQTPQQVFALPLINAKYTEEEDLLREWHGMVAKKNSVVKSIFQKVRRRTFLAGRYFMLPAQQEKEVLVGGDRAVMVGNGSLKAGPIADLFIEGDTVYAAVAEPVAGQLPGLFFSEPIFNAQGVITGWTSWQRVCGITKPVAGAMFDYEDGSFVTLTNADTDDIDTIKRTGWERQEPSSSTHAVQNILADQFSPEQGGIQGCFDFSTSTPGLHDKSLLIFTGYKKVAFMQTGYLVDDVLVPCEKPVKADCYKQGKIITTHSTLQIVSGGALDSLGMITSVECAAVYNGNKKEGLLFVGGVNGLTVLVDENGAGWQVDQNNHSSFGSLVENRSFKVMGNYTFIRKLMSDRNFLYVLTDTSLDRIDLAATNFSSGTVVATTLATAQTVVPQETLFFTDFLVSEKLAILGTSQGLFCNNYGTDIATVSSHSSWHHIPLPGGADSVISLYAKSVTGRPQDSTREAGGMLYVLNGYQGRDVTYVHRFTLSNTEFYEVSPFTVSLFSLNNIPSYYCRYVGTKNKMASQGSLYIVGQNRTGKTISDVKKTKDRDPFLILINHQGISVRIPVTTIPDQGLITGIVRDPASGKWVITGDFGLLINE